MLTSYSTDCKLARTNSPTLRDLQTMNANTSDTGISLVEVLVVLAIIGAIAVSTLITLRSPDSAHEIDYEANLFKSKVNSAIKYTLFTGQSAYLIWADSSYKFELVHRTVRLPHSNQHLSKTRQIPNNIVFNTSMGDKGEVAIIPNLVVPSDKANITFNFSRDGHVSSVHYDGARAHLAHDKGASN